MWGIWLIIAGFSFIIEMLTVGFLVFWFGIGALITMLVSFITDNLLIQTAVFIISSTLLILCTKPLLKRYVDKETIPTNVDSLIGKKGIVTKEINTTLSQGLVKINGDTWSAKTEDENETIEKGTEVEILKIDGVKVVVRKVPKLVTNSKVI
ncbi:MAG: NfeD family protein [Clostridia bacterium]